VPSRAGRGKCCKRGKTDKDRSNSHFDLERDLQVASITGVSTALECSSLSCRFGRWSGMKAAHQCPRRFMAGKGPQEAHKKGEGFFNI
jgi:hypothetical protein